MQIELSTEHVQFASLSELKAFNQRMILRYREAPLNLLMIAQVCDKKASKQVGERVSE